MKKTLALVLTMVLLTGLLAGCGGGGDSAIVGTWKASMEMAGQMNELFESSGMGDYLKLNSFAVVVDYTFNADGTYSCAADEEALSATLESAKAEIKDGLIAFAEDTAAQSGQEGLTADDVFAAAGTTLDEMLDQMFTEETIKQMVEELAAEGNYKTGDGKLYLSDGLDHQPDEEMYHNYTIEGDTLTLLDAVGGGEELTDMFPMELKKVE